MLYREFYVKERLANIDGKFNPNCPEVFLDESYCHVDYSAANTWVRPRGIVNESGRKPMLVIFAAFIVFKEGHGRKAEVIKDSVDVWPVKGVDSRINDYHGYFDAEKFERLFETICHAIQYYGSCIIHMDGASYHKRRINSVPTPSTKIDEIVTWFLQNNLLLPQDNQRAYTPDPEESTSSLREKLVNSLLNIPEESLKSVWRKAVDKCMSYHYELHTVNATVDLDEEDQDAEIECI
ncbi:hypothetical protein G6F56_007038 [Rhizopus delemar]|nr:hypothetical protein G6F56_007038 [Rhizopus delemar]